MEKLTQISNEINNLISIFKEKFNDIEFKYAIRYGLTCNHFYSLPEDIKKKMPFIQYELYNNLKDIVDDEDIVFTFSCNGLHIGYGANINDC